MLISAGGQLVFTLQEELAIIKELTRAEVKELEEVVKIQEGLPCIAVVGAKLLVDLHCFFFKGNFNIIEWRTGTLFTVSRRGCEMDAKALQISLNVCCSQGQGQVPKGVGNYTYGGS